MRYNPLYSVLKVIAVPLYKLLFFYKITGKENLPKEGGYIICSNHLSNNDPIFLGLAVNRQIYYMAKAELFKNPVLSALIRALGAFPVQRGAGDGKAINDAEKIIRDKKMLGIFIEGTRSKTGQFLRPKSGAAIIASQMNVPVLPLCITPKTKDRKVKLFHKTTISIGKPMTPAELGLGGEPGPEAYRGAARTIMGEIKALRAGVTGERAEDIK